jgi:long-chain acyl-CoA synthetase
MVVNPQTKADKLRYVLADAGAAALISDVRLARIAAPVAAELPHLHTLVLDGGAADAVATVAGAPRSTPAGRQTPPEPHAERRHPARPGRARLHLGQHRQPQGRDAVAPEHGVRPGEPEQYLRLASDDRILNVLPLAFDYGLYQALMAVHWAPRWCSRRRSPSPRRW